MKKLLLILLCLPIIGFGQGWRYSSGGNDFDGKYSTSSIVGTGDVLFTESIPLTI